MTVTSPVVESPAAETDPPPPGRRPRWRADLLVGAGYLVVAGWVMLALLLHPVTRIVPGGATEQQQSEWWLRHAARWMTGAEPLLRATQPGVRGRVPILFAHGFPGLSVPLAPVTLLLGPARTFALAVTLCLAGTAYCWYHVLSANVVRTRTAAVLGGALGGFAPAMISHAQGDLPRVALFLVPLLVWRIRRLGRPGHALWDGLVLGALVAWQVLIDIELALIFGLAAVVFVGVYLTLRRAVRDLLPAARSLGVATLVATGLLAYPLWTQGPPPRTDPLGIDLFSFVAFSPSSVATWPVGALHYARLTAEQQTFYGWPLVVALVAGWWWLRGPTQRALAVTGLAVAALSLGDQIVLKDQPTPVPGPWHWLGQLPPLRMILPIDLALGLLPVVVLVAAVLIDRGTAAAGTEEDRRVRLVWWALLAAVLLPIAPVPVGAVHFIGPSWRRTVVTDGTP